MAITKTKNKANNNDRAIDRPSNLYLNTIPLNLKQNTVFY